MKDNFSLYKDLLPAKDDCVYRVIIINRYKETGVERETIHFEYLINNYEELVNLKPEIVALSELHKSRVYIRLESISKSDIINLAIINIARRLQSKTTIDPHELEKISVMDAYMNNSYYIIDIDDNNKVNEIREYIIKQYAQSEKLSIEDINNNIEKYIIAEIPSVTGTHLVVKPFYSNNWSSIYPDVHILRGAFPAGSLLYYPDSLTNQ